MRKKSLLRWIPAALLALLLGVPGGYADTDATAATDTASPTATTRIERNEPATAQRDAPQPLDRQEVAQLESRTERPGEEVAGGALTNQQLTYILIAVAAAVVVLVLK